MTAAEDMAISAKAPEAPAQENWTTVLALAVSAGVAGALATLMVLNALRAFSMISYGCCSFPDMYFRYFEVVN